MTYVAEAERVEEAARTAVWVVTRLLKGKQRRPVKDGVARVMRKLHLEDAEFSDVAAGVHSLSCNVQVEMREAANALSNSGFRRVARGY